MATHPANKYDDSGRLVERAITERGAVEDIEAVAVTGRPNDVAGPNSTFASRTKARLAGAKQVGASDAENKSVAAKKTAKK